MSLLKSVAPGGIYTFMQVSAVRVIAAKPKLLSTKFERKAVRFKAKVFLRKRYAEMASGQHLYLPRTPFLVQAAVIPGVKVSREADSKIATQIKKRKEIFEVKVL